jgi:acyl carrier protein
VASQNALSSDAGLTAFAHIIANLTWPQIIVSTQEFTSLVARNRLLTLDYYLETFGHITDSHKAYPRPSLSKEYVPPQSAAEKQLVQIWQNLLGISPIGIHDNFFDLGGHSLLGTQVISQIRQQFRAELPLQLIFEMPTVAELAQYLEREHHSQSSLPPEIPAEGYQDETIDQLLSKITGSEKERPQDE